MNYFKKIEDWGDVHQSKWLAVFRILLGLIIFFKGLSFLENTDEINAMIANSAVSIYAVALAHIVALAHLMGGVLITIGLMTRLACLFQVPILIGAIIFVMHKKDFSRFILNSAFPFSCWRCFSSLLFLVQEKFPWISSCGRMNIHEI